MLGRRWGRDAGENEIKSYSVWGWRGGGWVAGHSREKYYFVKKSPRATRVKGGNHYLLSLPANNILTQLLPM